MCIYHGRRHLERSSSNNASFLHRNVPKDVIEVKDFTDFQRLVTSAYLGTVGNLARIRKGNGFHWRGPYCVVPSGSIVGLPGSFHGLAWPVSQTSLLPAPTLHCTALHDFSVRIETPGVQTASYQWKQMSGLIHIWTGNLYGYRLSEAYIIDSNRSMADRMVDSESQAVPAAPD